MDGALLVMAHPAHELRIWEFVRRYRPTFCILTDGTGGGAISRIGWSQVELLIADCRQGPLFDVGSDRQIYNCFLQGDVEQVIGWSQVLAEWIVREQPAYVVGDALEGFNPVHDLCRYLIDSACRDARAAGWSGENLAFPLEGLPSARPRDCDEIGIELQLDTEALDIKLKKARSHPYIQHEVEAALSACGEQAFATESLFKARGRSYVWDWGDAPPDYERHGQDRVGRAHYELVITWREHVRPIAEALAQPHTALP